MSTHMSNRTLSKRTSSASRKASTLLLLALGLIFAFSIFWPLARGGQPLSLGLDLSGGAMVTYRPDLDSVPERYAGLDEGELLAMAKETLSGRLMHRFDTLPDVVVRGDGRIVVSLPGEHDQRRILETIGKTYRLTFRQALAVHDTPPPTPQGLLLPYEGRWLDLGEELLAGHMLEARSIRVDSGGGSLESLGQGAVVAFSFRPPYDERFAAVTRDSIGKTLAILLDDEVEWAGRVEEEIRGMGVLRGGYTLEQASEVASLLRSGNLPLSLSVESISGVGPTLGQELLSRGQLALAWSAALLALLILLAYGHRPALLLTGWASLACLLFFTLGFICTFGLTVDLVAIAGLVLSIGMGMDAFILVFEALEGGRAPAGRSPLGRLREVYGFRGEGRTLVHANATTLLVVLLLFAPDRLQSFALFLVVGITASLLTIVVTRRLLASFARRGWLESQAKSWWPDLLGLVRRARPGLFRFRHLYFAALAVFLLGTAFWLQSQRAATWLAMGADFQPGVQLQITLPAEQAIEPLMDDLRQTYPDLQARYQAWNGDGVGADEAGYLVTLDTLLAPGDLGHWLEGREAALRKIDAIDARLSSRRMLSSLSVLVFSFLFLGLYLGFQRRIDGWLTPGLRRPTSAGGRIFAGTVLAVFLDLLVVLAALALLDIPLGMPVIAALLTIVGYSVNDSMVLWSHLSQAPVNGDPAAEPSTARRIRDGVDQILSRAVLTSLSTTVPALTILAAGLEPLRGFAWAVLVGTVAGTLSSMFVVATFALGTETKRARAARPKPKPSEALGRLGSL